MMNFYVNAYAGRHDFSEGHIFFTRERADLMAEPTRIGVIRVRPKTQPAWQHCHLWASWAEEVFERAMGRIRELRERLNIPVEKFDELVELAAVNGQLAALGAGHG